MDQNVFKIDGKIFQVPDEHKDSNSFTIQSIPRSYPVIWNEASPPFEMILDIMMEHPRNLMLIDTNVYKLYCKQLDVANNRIIKIDALESSKTLNGVLRLIDFLAKHQFTKEELLIVVGGGIIQDIGAFVGASFKRGIPWVYFPTTLLSMCDSCIGGKTGINHDAIKNQLALFSSPHKVIINPNFLKTLETREIRSGIGEILKLHITGGTTTLSQYQKSINGGLAGNIDDLKMLILGALAVKKIIVEEDEFELNVRKSLNYGHTIGHAIEAMSGFRISHGQAVSVGMILINELSYENSLLSSDENNLLKQLCFQLINNEICSEMREISKIGFGGLLRQDKKTTGNNVNFVMLQSIGDMQFYPFTINEDLEQSIFRTISKEFDVKKNG